MTGRGAGYCAGYGVPGYLNPVPGRGFGFGFGRGRGWFGRGRGWGRWFYGAGWPGWAPYAWGPGVPPAPSTATESQFLKQEAEALRRQLDAINKRLDDASLTPSTSASTNFPPKRPRKGNSSCRPAAGGPSCGSRPATYMAGV